MAVEKTVINDSYKITPATYRIIAGKAALSVKGITALINKKGSFIFLDDLIKDNGFIALKESANQLIIELSVAVAADVVIPDLSKVVQTAIRNKVEKMTQVSVKSVIVNIGALYLGKENSKVIRQIKK